MYSMYIKNRFMKVVENNNLKQDLHAVLEKHGVSATEAMVVLDELYYGKQDKTHNTVHYTKGNSE